MILVLFFSCADSNTQTVYIVRHSHNKQANSDAHITLQVKSADDYTA